MVAPMVGGVTTAEFQKLIQLGEWQFAFGQRAEHRLLMADLWGRALYEQHTEALRLPVQPQDALFAAPTKAYVKKAQRAEVLSAMRAALQEGYTYLQYVRDAVEKVVRTFEEHVTNIVAATGTSGAPARTVLATLWAQHDAALVRVIPWFYIPWYITEENFLTDRVRDGLVKHRARIETVTDYPRALPLLITPTKHMLFQEEQEAFFQLVDLAEQTPGYEREMAFRRRAEEYLAAWSWTTTLAFLPLVRLSFAQLLERVRDAVAKKARADADDLQRQRLEGERQAAELLRILAADRQLTSDIAWAREFGWLLTWSVEATIRAAARLHPFYQAVAVALGISWSDLTRLFSIEIQEGLHGKLPVTVDELARRCDGYVYVMLGGRATVVTGADARRVASWLTENLERADRSVSEFRGHPAAPGSARGRARICLTPQDAEKLLAGEVLVCSMTSPDYVPAMQRAGAIVTDEGGLLAHAAIVSRELGKPCVVGTKIATRVLKDGDEVEVDANRGIVKILKKAT